VLFDVASSKDLAGTAKYVLLKMLVAHGADACTTLPDGRRAVSCLRSTDEECKQYLLDAMHRAGCGLN
jgi:hypothetical protein